MSCSASHYFRLQGDYATLTVKVQPGARSTEVVGPEALAGGDYALKIKLHAPPVDGRANEALIAHLSDYLGLPQRNFSIVQGATGRLKRLRLDAPPQALEAMMTKLQSSLK